MTSTTGILVVEQGSIKNLLKLKESVTENCQTLEKP